MINFPLPRSDWRLTQKYGLNPDIYKKFGLKGHNGLDMAPPKPGQVGYIVFAPHEGYVTTGVEMDSLGRFYGYGNFVSIVGLPDGKDGHCQRSDLAHLASFIVQNGQYVHQGDPVGVMGRTGFADGIHLHWTYKKMKDGITLNKYNGFKGGLDILQYCCTWESWKG